MPILPKMVNITWTCNPISFKHIMFWYLFLDPHLPPTHHSNYSLGVQIPIVVLGLGVLLPSTPSPSWVCVRKPNQGGMWWIVANGWGEPAVIYRGTGCIWEITGWSSRLVRKLPIILEEFIAYTPMQWRKPGKMSTCNRVCSKTSPLPSLCLFLPSGEWNGNQWSERFFGIITGGHPSVCKSNRYNMLTSSDSPLNRGTFHKFLKKWPVISLQSLWTSTGGYFSNSTGSFVTNCRFCPITDGNLTGVEWSGVDWGIS